MRTIKTTTGAEISLDSDLLAMLETLFKEVTAQATISTDVRGHDARDQPPRRPDDARRPPAHTSSRACSSTPSPTRTNAWVPSCASSRTSPPRTSSSRPVSLNYLATRFTCSWPWETAVLLCDGRIVCGCADPVREARARRHAQRRRSPTCGAATTARRLRDDLNKGGSTFCGDCPLKLPLDADSRRRSVRSTSGPCPAGSTSSARPPATSRASRPAARRRPASRRRAQAGMLDVDLFRALIDEAGPTLGRIDFFNYGEAFLHKRAVEMCELHQGRATRTSISTRAPTGSRSPRSRRGAWFARASTR